jgi:cell division protein ZapA
MATVTVSINGRNYRMACDDGQEEHLGRLARELDQRIAQLRSDFGEIGDMRLTVMAALTIADELSEQRARVAAADHARTTERAVAAAFSSAAERIEKLAKALDGRGPVGPADTGG